MGRFLVVVPPLVGHTNPTVPVGRELVHRGHTVAWAGHPEVIADLLPPGAPFLPVADAVPQAIVDATNARLEKRTGGIGGFASLWETCVLPLAHHMLPGTFAAVDGFRPDVLLVDQHALAGAAVAEARGLPWATSATTSADLVDPIEALPKVAAWLRDQMAGVLRAAGVAPERAAAVDPRFSPHLLLAFTVPDLVGPVGSLPDHYALVGPSFGDRPADPSFPWDWLGDPGDGRPNVLVSLGTLNWKTGERFFTVVAEAFRGLDARAVVVAPPGLVPDPPPNVLLRSWVPQLALLPRMDAVVCHGGHNTVCESLAHGLPLVVAAIRDDQPIIADQVARAGAGVRVKFTRVAPAELRDALRTVLTDPGPRAAAGRLRASLEGAGGPAAAADRLEALLTRAPASAEPASPTSPPSTAPSAKGT
ncbi:MAG TPA: nucleotide disphospho-sugar-binding domain-containing protein [Acidimicrobiales bacterium]